MKRAGFTIVELLIVIVVIAVLAAITVVAFNGIQQRAMSTSLKSELNNVAKKMELAKAETEVYPSAFPSDTKIASNLTLSLSQASNGFCINGEHKNNTSIRWRYESATGGLQEGLCSGAVIAGSEPGMNPNLVTNTDFASGWSLGFQNVTGRTLSVRAGATNDPYPSRPVLVLTNSGTGATTWAVLQSSGLNHSAIQTGKSYTRSLWVRKTGPYAGTLASFAVMTGGGTNPSLGTGANISPTDSWQQVSSAAAVASSNSDPSKILYQAIAVSAFTTSGWTLEFQGFELREQ